MILNSLGKILFCACVALWLLVLLNSTAQPAYCYVDPGSGLLLMQIVGSTFAGIMVLLRKQIRQLFGRFSRNSTKDGSDIVSQ